MTLYIDCPLFIVTYFVKVPLSAVKLILRKLKHFYFLSAHVTSAGSILMPQAIQPLSEDYLMELLLTLIISMIEFTGQMLVMAI